MRTIDRSPRDADLSGDLCRSYAAAAKLAHPVSLGSGSRSAALVFAFGLGLGDADKHPLARQFPLELSDAAKQVEHEPASRRRPVDRLIQHLEGYTLGFQLGAYLAKVRNAPGKPV